MSVPRRNTVRALLVSIVLGVAAITVVVVWLGPESFRGIATVDRGWLALACALLVSAWGLAGLKIVLLARRVGARLPLVRATRAHLLGQFASAITPGGAGGMPAIVMTLIARGVPPPRAWSVGIAVTAADLAFIGWTLPLALAWLRTAGALPDHPAVLPAAVTVGVLALLGSGLLVLRQEWLLPVGRALLRGPFRRWRDRLLAGIERLLAARDALTRARWGWHLRFHAIVALSWWCLFAVLWCVARGFGLEADPRTVIGGLTFVQIAGAAVPTPGASGLMELGGSLALAGAGTQERRGVAAAVLLWRAMTFYLPFLLGPAIGGYELTRLSTARRDDA